MPPGARFPDGWKFVIDPTVEGFQSCREPIADPSIEGYTGAKGLKILTGLKILPPTVSRGTYYSVEGAKSHYQKSLKDVCAQPFYAHIGVVAVSGSRHEIDYNISDDESILTRPHKMHRTQEIFPDEIESTTDHFLVGRNVCFVWTNLKREDRILYGKVAECERNVHSGEVSHFKVIYSPQYRQVLNSNAIGHWLAVPESQVLPYPLVLGGCILYEKHAQVTNEMSLLRSYLPNDKPFYWSWISPDLSHEELIDNNFGGPLPRLTLMLRGFRLELNVKPSGIPNAGYGVFLRSVRLLEDASDDHPVDSFMLGAGELVDLGVYAPFRIEDKKLEAVSFVKNFVHCYKIEKWYFDASDTRFHLDITDDVTGDLHTAAMSHIPAYVNESIDDEKVNIRAEHDPEGSVHYLLGHLNQVQGTFHVPTDGSEVELHVNYGHLYEQARVRNGYSFVSDEEQALIKEKILHEEVEDVEEMDRFGEADIEACVNFFSTLFSTNDKSKFTPEVIERTLTCAVVLQRRAHRLLLEVSEGDSSDAGGVSLKRVLKKAGLLVLRLMGMARDDWGMLKPLQNNGNFDELLKGVFERHFSCEELCELDEMMK
jgi:hypothetical protein